MAFSLLQLASMVQNNVSAGLRGQQNFTYSLEQLKDELTLERNGALHDLEDAGKALPLDACAQRLDALPLVVADYTQLPAGVAEVAGLEDLVRRPVLSFELPTLLALRRPVLAVRYAGPISRSVPWRVAFTQDQVTYDQHQLLPVTTPLVFFEQSRGWVLGGRVPQRTISLTAVFENPLLVGNYPGGSFHEESEYPMPDFIARAAVQRLTNKYISQYGRLQVQPNDGTAQV